MPLMASILRYVFVESTPGLKSTVLELPEVCKTGNGIKAKQSPDVQARVAFTELRDRGHNLSGLDAHIPINERNALWRKGPVDDHS